MCKHNGMDLYKDEKYFFASRVLLATAATSFISVGKYKISTFGYANNYFIN